MIELKDSLHKIGNKRENGFIICNTISIKTSKMNYSINALLHFEKEKAIGIDNGTIAWNGKPYWSGIRHWEWCIEQLGGLTVLEFQRDSDFGKQSFRMEIEIKTIQDSNERYYELRKFSCENLMNFANICALTENVQRIILMAINTRPA